MSEVFKEYEKKWIENKRLWLEKNIIEPPVFPIIIISKYKNKIDFMKVNNFEEIFQPDYIGYRWEDDEYFIDSKGYQYKVGYIDMNHPVGFVFPLEIIRKFKINDFLEFCKSSLNVDKINNKDKNYSIKDIINIL
jgi:hypothetical protein